MHLMANNPPAANPAMTFQCNAKSWERRFAEWNRYAVLVR
jgi:hypothetical protein